MLFSANHGVKSTWGFYGELSADKKFNRNPSSVSKLNRVPDQSLPSSKTELPHSKDLRTEVIWKRKLDEVRSKVANRQAYLLDLQDKLEEYSKTNTLVVDEEASNKRIKILENKVDNLMIKFNEAMNIKRMYEGLILSLRHQRTTYDKQISKMEQAAEAEETEVQLAASAYQKALLAKQACSQKYKDYEARRDEVHNLREKYLLNRKVTDLESVQRKEIKKTEEKIKAEGKKYSLFRTSGFKKNDSDEEVNEDPETIDYNFLDEFFQRIFEISGAKDGEIISQ